MYSRNKHVCMCLFADLKKKKNNLFTTYVGMAFCYYKPIELLFILKIGIFHLRMAFSVAEINI